MFLLKARCCFRVLHFQLCLLLSLKYTKMWHSSSSATSCLRYIKCNSTALSSSTWSQILFTGRVLSTGLNSKSSQNHITTNSISSFTNTESTKTILSAWKRNLNKSVFQNSFVSKKYFSNSVHHIYCPILVFILDMVIRYFCVLKIHQSNM